MKAAKIMSRSLQGEVRRGASKMPGRNMKGALPRRKIPRQIWLTGAMKESSLGPSDEAW